MEFDRNRPAAQNLHALVECRLGVEARGCGDLLAQNDLDHGAIERADDADHALPARGGAGQRGARYLGKIRAS